MKNILGGTLEVIKEETGKSAKTAFSQITGKQVGKQQQVQPVKKPQGNTGGVSGAVKKTLGLNDQPDAPLVQSKGAALPKEPPDETKEFVKDLYGSEKPQIKPEEVQQQEIEDKQKTEALRQRLHSDYYQRLTNPPKQQEERPAEKVEKEKKVEMQELEQKEAKKPKPLAIDRAERKTETFRGTAG